MNAAPAFLLCFALLVSAMADSSALAMASRPRPGAPASILALNDPHVALKCEFSLGHLTLLPSPLNLSGQSSPLSVHLWQPASAPPVVLASQGGVDAQGLILADSGLTRWGETLLECHDQLPGDQGAASAWGVLGPRTEWALAHLSPQGRHTCLGLALHPSRQESSPDSFKLRLALKGKKVAATLRGTTSAMDPLTAKGRCSILPLKGPFPISQEARTELERYAVLRALREDLHTTLQTYQKQEAQIVERRHQLDNEVLKRCAETLPSIPPENCTGHRRDLEAATTRLLASLIHRTQDSLQRITTEALERLASMH